MPRRRAIPEKLTLNGKRWTVKQVSGLKDRGDCDVLALTISIDADMADDLKEATLAHEVLHAIWPKGICSDAEEERLIEALEDPIHAAFKVRR